MERSICQALTSALAKSPYHSLRAVVCEYHEGVITLRGTVPSYFLKQQAQSLALALDDALNVDNRIVVNAAADY